MIFPCNFHSTLGIKELSSLVMFTELIDKKSSLQPASLQPGQWQMTYVYYLHTTRLQLEWSYNSEWAFKVKLSNSWNFMKTSFTKHIITISVKFILGLLGFSLSYSAQTTKLSNTLLYLLKKSLSWAGKDRV